MQQVIGTEQLHVECWPDSGRAIMFLIFHNKSLLCLMDGMNRISVLAPNSPALYTSSRDGSTPLVLCMGPGPPFVPMPVPKLPSGCRRHPSVPSHTAKQPFRQVAPSAVFGKYSPQLVTATRT